MIPQQTQKQRLVDIYVHNRLDEVIISRHNTQDEINQRTFKLAIDRLRRSPRR